VFSDIFASFFFLYLSSCSSLQVCRCVDALCVNVVMVNGCAVDVDGCWWGSPGNATDEGQRKNWYSIGNRRLSTMNVNHSRRY
jgi:hypothetical protein